ncbi:DUF2383 domain-containing protein [Mariniflexile sp.]|uniref:DUF2383 domain-containing protein n=1 Tax=Mariniflexile sp. TaxID=1979402 RepID=UPI00356ADA89
MKSAEKILKKLNNLLVMNYEVEKIYLGALDLATNDNLKAFFTERAFERNEFSRQLRTEINKLKGEPIQLGKVKGDLKNFETKFKNHLLINNEDDLMTEVFKLKSLCIDGYNELLMQINLPLSTCKMLVKQRDSIYSNMNAMKRQEEFVV